MNFAHRRQAWDQHELPGKMKLGRARCALAIRRLFGRFHDPCHSERSRGIWPRIRGMAHSPVCGDARCCVSTTARHDNGRLAAFTLIELLVVISVIALLMAILMPALARVRRQAKSLGCQAKLRQWGLAIKCYTDENDGKFWQSINLVQRDPTAAAPEPEAAMWWNVLGPYYAGNRKMLLCPMTGRRLVSDFEWYEHWGTTFIPWFGWAVPRYDFFGSYGMNVRLHPVQEISTNAVGRQAEVDSNRMAWRTCLVRGANNVPAFLDCIWWDCGAIPDTQCPPPEELPAYEPPKQSPRGIHVNCINRHDGGINGVFLDWSIRKVGLKELWTLKWDREYNTRGEWTKAGGVQPEDWPAWMRKFKDY